MKRGIIRWILKYSFCRILGNEKDWVIDRRSICDVLLSEDKFCCRLCTEYDVVLFKNFKFDLYVYFFIRMRGTEI